MNRREITLVLTTMCVLTIHARTTMAQQGPALVTTAPIEERDLKTGQTFVGTVRPIRMSTIGSAVDGRIEEFYFSEGDCIKKGEPLVKLRSGTLELERDGALADLDVRWEELLELVNGYRPEEIEEARAIASASQARWEYARARRERGEQLRRQGEAITEDELQERINEARQAEQVNRQMQASLKLKEMGHRDEVIAQAHARFISQLELVQKLEDQIYLHTIRAPFDGYITREHSELGTWLVRGAPAVDMVQLDFVDVEAAVTEMAVAHLRAGQSARVQVASLADRTFTGEVVHIVPFADPRTRSFPVKVRVANLIDQDVPLLKANMFAEVTLPVGPQRKALVVPKDAVVLGGDRPVIFVFEPSKTDTGKGSVRPIEVQLGVADEDAIEVIGPVRVGQLVVIRGNERLRPGQEAILARGN